MCNPIDESRIRGKVAEMVSKGKVFTAFDVTQELRNAFSDFSERHKVVRGIIHNMFSMGGFSSLETDYDKTYTILSINGQDVDVCVFHPVDASPEDHPLVKKETFKSIFDKLSDSFLNTDTQSIKPSFGGGKVIADAVRNLAKQNSETEEVFVTSDNRLQIPKKILNVVGDLNEYDILLGGVRIKAKKNKDGRVRLGDTALSVFGTPIPESFYVSVDQNTKEIVISV